MIVDLGSSNEKSVGAMNVLPEHLQAVGGHPMCGKETSGPQNADGELFRDRPFVVCHTHRTTDAAWELVGAMIDAIGAHCISLSAEQHDQAVAVISHLPYLLSIGLVASVQQAAQTDTTPLPLASSGFRDTSRVAGSDVSLISD